MRRGRYEIPRVQYKADPVGRLHEETPTMLRRKRNSTFMSLDDKIEAAFMLYIEKEK